MPPVPFPTRADETAKLSRGVSVSYADKVLTCRDCGQSFVFTVGEQEFFASRGFTNDPSRCRDCRTARRGASGGGGGYGGGGSRRDREMFSVTCSACGNDALVPFQPRGDKPVYCSDCFSKTRGTSGGGGGYGGGGG